MPQTGHIRQLAGNADIGHHHLRAAIIRERIGAGAFGHHIIAGHLQRSVDRVSTHTVTGHPVVSAGHHHARNRDRRSGAADDSRILANHRAEMPQTTPRRQKAGHFFFRLIHGLAIQFANPCQCSFKQFHRTLLHLPFKPSIKTKRRRLRLSARSQKKPSLSTKVPSLVAAGLLAPGSSTACAFPSRVALQVLPGTVAGPRLRMPGMLRLPYSPRHAGAPQPETKFNCDYYISY